MLKNHPKFSIITPTFNRAYVLWKAITSIQKQSVSDWELLVIDDGSTDDTQKLLAEFQEDMRIKTFTQKNQGPAVARNLGLENATGDIVVYLDSDDTFYPDCLWVIDQCLSAQPDKNYGVCNHNRTQEFIDETFKTKALKVDSTPQNKTVTMEDFYYWNVKTTSTGLFHRRAIFQGKIKWTPDLYIEDLELLMQLAVLNEEGFVHIPQTLFSYRQKYGGDGLCSNASYETWAQSFGKIYELHRHDPLMKNPDVFLGRVEKYNDLHQKNQRGEIATQVYKFFPEMWEQKLANR